MLDHRGLLNRVMVRRTKREVTDAAGNPIFMRRQVITQSFILGARERNFYEKLTEYLREGYGVAGLGQTRTTSYILNGNEFSALESSRSLTPMHPFDFRAVYLPPADISSSAQHLPALRNRLASSESR